MSALTLVLFYVLSFTTNNLCLLQSSSTHDSIQLDAKINK